MAFLHISQKPVPTYLDDAGSTYKGSSRPSGLWYGHGLSWVEFMEKNKSWSPQIVSAEMHPLPVYEHVFGEKKLLARQDGDTLTPVNAAVHYVYKVPIPPGAFQPPSYAGPDKAKKIMQITSKTLGELLTAKETDRKNWYKTKAATALAASYGGADPLRSMFVNHWMWNNDQSGTREPDETYIAIVDYLLKTKGALIGDQKKRAEGIVARKKGAGLIDLKSDRLRPIIAEAVSAGAIKGNAPRLIEIEDLYWQPIIQAFSKEWGGMDFAKEVFTPEAIRTFPLIHFVSAESGVLFKPTQVLGKADASKDLAAILSWDSAAEPGYPGVPRFVFGLTTKGDIRVLESAGGRRRTRRRMLKNPKTLKKRVRKVVLLRMF